MRLITILLISLFLVPPSFGATPLMGNHDEKMNSFLQGIPESVVSLKITNDKEEGP